MSRYLDTSTTTQMAEIMVQYGKPSCSSWTESVWSSFGRTIVGIAIWESSLEIRNWECFSYTVKKDYSYLKMWMTSNCLERNNLSTPFGKSPWETSIWATMFIWVALKENVKSARTLWIITEVCFESRMSAGALGNFLKQKQRGTWCRSKIFMVTKHGKSWEQMFRKILRACEKNNWAIIQSRNATSIIINLETKKMDQLEICPQFVYKLFWIVCI